MPEDLKSKKAELGNDSVKTIHSICCLSCLEEQTELKNKMVKKKYFYFVKNPVLGTHQMSRLKDSMNNVNGRIPRIYK